MERLSVFEKFREEKRKDKLSWKDVVTYTKSAKALIKLAEEKRKSYPPIGDKKEAFYFNEAKELIVKIAKQKYTYENGRIRDLVIEFTSVDTKQSAIGQFARILTINNPDLFDMKEALWLSDLSPQQLDGLTGLLKNSNPLEVAEYKIKQAQTRLEIDRRNYNWPFSGNA